MRFLLLEGIHKDGEESYKKGDIVRSQRQLDTIFRGKFQQVAESGLPIETEIGDSLPKLTSEEAQWLGASPDVDTSKVDTTEKESPDFAEYGKDVTDKSFPEAAKAGMRIFRKKSFYTVIDTDDNSVMNSKKLKREQLEEFIGDFIEEQSKADKD